MYHTVTLYESTNKYYIKQVLKIGEKILKIGESIEDRFIGHWRLGDNIDRTFLWYHLIPMAIYVYSLPYNYPNSF